MKGKKSVSLALQGGGSHGAFTWGVLDWMLQDERLHIEAISGTSAGAMNAIMVADGLMRDGPQGARDALRQFWKSVSDAALLSPIKRNPINVWLGDWSMDNSPGYLFFDLINRLASPYDINPLEINPLKDILEANVDFDLVRCCNAMELFVSATNVETGRVRVFRREELTADMVMASACLPQLFRAVEIDGVPYWDGGYMGNPVLFPFHHGTTCNDIVIVQINPVERPGTPRTAQEIYNRVNEITFNSSLLKELRSIDFVRRLIDDGRLDSDKYHRMRIHIVESHEALGGFGAASKVNAEWGFLEKLHDVGQRAAKDWVDEHFDSIGERSTVDLRSMFDGIGVEHFG